MSKSQDYVGVDLGGTKISAGLVQEGTVANIYTCNTEPLNGREQILQNLFCAIDKVITQKTKAIGVGLPGIIDSERGIIYEIVNIPSWENLKLKEILESRYAMQVEIDNDANCFALGTWNYGVAKGFKHVVALSLGTGLGAGIIANGELYRGLNNGAGEFGQIPYLDSIYESYCSGQFFTLEKNIQGEALYNQAQDGENNAIEIWNEFGQHLASLVTTILYSISPEVIVFGGSVSRGFEYFRASIENNLQNIHLQRIARNVKLLQEYRSDLSVLGAAALCF